MKKNTINVPQIQAVTPTQYMRVCVDRFTRLEQITPIEEYVPRAIMAAQGGVDPRKLRENFKEALEDNRESDELILDKLDHDYFLRRVS